MTLLTPQDAAARLKLSVKTVREYIKQNRVRGINLNPNGKRPVWRIVEDSLPDRTDVVEQLYQDAKERLGL